MKKIWLFYLLSVALTSLMSAQNNPKSPAKTLEATINGIHVKVTYHSPAVRDRDIWGALVPYDKIWRTGANDATVITLSADAKIHGKAVAAGSYSLFTIPSKDKWTLILNSDTKQWGAYKYDMANDVLRVDVTPVKSDSFNENMSFEHMDNKIAISWENLIVPFTVSK